MTVGAMLEDLFQMSASMSQEWKTWQETTTTQTFTETETFTMDITVEPGETVVIGQRVARCGQYKVSTYYKAYPEFLGNEMNRARRLKSRIQVNKVLNNSTTS